MKKEKNNLLIDTRHISNVESKYYPTTSIISIKYTVDLTKFDYGSISNITDVHLQWINMDNSHWDSSYQEYMYLNIYELGDRISSNGNKQRSSFVIPTSQRNLIFMSEPLANHIHYPEPIYKLDKLYIELSWKILNPVNAPTPTDFDESTGILNNPRHHSMLLTFESNRQREY